MIDRKQILWGITDEEDKYFLSKMCDLAQKADTTCRIMYSKFLNPGQQMLLKERANFFGNMEFFGGYENSDRCIVSFLGSQWDECDYPICALKICPTSKKTYSHRDYLGSILALGIDRELTGDIVMCPDGAYVFVLKDISDFICMSLSKVANSSVKINLEEDLSKIVSARRFKETDVTVSSLRFDCVLSAASNKSRSVSAECITEGLATVNYSVVKNVSYQIKNGDVISLKGFGKVIVETDGFLTKKGRIHLKLKKYI